MKYKSRALALKTQTTQETVAPAERCLVLDLDLAHHSVDALIVHLDERKTCVLAEFVSCMLHIMQIIGIIDYLLAVEFVVADLHVHYEAIFLFCIL